MVKRTTRITLEVLGAVLVLTVVVASVLVWRLAQGPVDLDSLTPRIEQALSDLQPGITVSLGQAQLTWEGWPENIILRANEVEVTSEGEHVASLPSIDFDFSFPALASGTLAPTGVAVRGARLTLIRDEDGLAFAGMEDRPQVDISEILPVLLEDLMAEPDPAKPLSYLNSIRLVEARTQVHDALLDVIWDAPATTIALGRKPGGLTGTIQGPVMLGLSEVNLDAALEFDAASGRSDVTANLRGLEPNALAGMSPAFKPLSGLKLPVSGTVKTSFDVDSGLGEVSANLKGGSGTVSLPGLFAQPLPVAGLDATLRANSARGVVNLDSLQIDFAPQEEDEGEGEDEATPAASLQAQARLTGLWGDMKVEALARAENVTAEALPRYWPEQVVPPGRKWVSENIRDGVAEAATARLTASIPEGDFAKLSIERLEGEFRYRGLEVHYLRSLTPVREVSGTAAFDMDSLRLFPSSGRLNDIQLNGAEIEITNFESGDAPTIAIDFTAAGPLRTTLELLDEPRLQLISKLGLDPSRTRGRAEVQAGFDFPLLKDLKLDALELAVDAKLSDVAVDGFILDQDARGGQFDLLVNMNGMELAGPVALGGIPLDLHWRESFEDDPDVRSDLRARIPSIRAEQLARLGLEVSPYLEGPVSVNLSARADNAGRQRVLASANLQQARLALPGTGWEKQPGERAQARFDVRLEEGAPRRLERFELSAVEARAGPLDLAGQIDFSGDGGEIDALRLDTLRFRGSRLDTLHADHGAGAWRIALGGGTLDLSPLMESFDPGDQAASNGDSLPPFRLTAAHLDRLELGEGRHVEDVSLRLRRDVLGRWRALHLAGQVPGAFSAVPSGGNGETRETQRPATAFLFDYGPREDGHQTLRIEAEDSGAVLRVFDAYDMVKGGRLTVQGVSREAAANSPIDARVTLLNIRAVEAPILARVLTLASLTGIGDRLGSDEGIHFQSVTGDIVLHGDGVVTTKQLHAYGPSLGLTAEGQVDVPGRRIELDGVVVPAASINRVVEAIPLLGPLLTGGEGEGIIAINYALSGPMDDPSVSVNPLSALTPGFLRTLFGALGGQMSDGGNRDDANQGGDNQGSGQVSRKAGDKRVLYPEER